MSGLRDILTTLVLKSFLLDSSQKRVFIDEVINTLDLDEIIELKVIFENEKEFILSFYKEMIKKDCLNIPINDLKGSLSSSFIKYIKGKELRETKEEFEEENNIIDKYFIS